MRQTVQSWIKTVRAVGLSTIAVPILLVAARSSSETSTILGPAVRPWAEAAAWIAGAVACNRILRRWALDAVARRWFRAEMPRLFKDLASLILYAVAFASAFASVSGRSITGVWATGGVLTIILGLALQSIILDLFVGVAMHFERPFGEGDWIGVGDGLVGEVMSLNWRTVQLRTIEKTIVVVPNSTLGKQTFTNYSNDERLTRFDHVVRLEFDVLPSRGIRLLEAAARAVAETGVISLARPPMVLVDDADDSGVHYRIHYWIDPWRETPPPVAKSAVLASVAEHLHAAGVGIAIPMVIVPPALDKIRNPSDPLDHGWYLGRCEPFEELDLDEISAVGSTMERVSFRAGDVVVTGGEPVDRVILLVEGVAAARLSHPVGGRTVDAFLVEPGDLAGALGAYAHADQPVDLVAATDVEGLAIKSSMLYELGDRHHSVTTQLAAIAVERRLAIATACRVSTAAETVRPAQASSRTRAQLTALTGRARSVGKAANRILIVDDSAMLRASVRAVAEEAGWQVVGEASDGLDAVEQYRRLWPDLVTMDLVMPNLDGIGALSEIRRMHGKARVLMVSAIDQKDKLAEALHAGALDFVVKPFDPTHMVGTLTKLRTGPRADDS